MSATYNTHPRAVTLPCYYLAPVSYYMALYRNGGASVEVYDTYAKQTLRNRCLIDSPQGTLALTIPVQKPGDSRLVRDIRISDHGNWRHQHWQALASSYRQSPFFEYYADDLAPFYEKRREFLADFNMELLHLMCSLLDMDVSLERTSSFAGKTDGTWNAQPVRPYYQVFAHKHGFLHDLSIVDLLFNMGPESVLSL